MIAVDPGDLRSYDLILVNTSGSKDRGHREEIAG